MTARLGIITLFPVKSLEGIRVDSCRVAPGGFLENDRIYALFDGAGKYVNGKRDPRVHRLRCTFDPLLTEVGLRVEGDGMGGQFPLEEPSRLNRWLSDYFGFPVSVKRDVEAGFPDDRDAFGPTVVSDASLRAVASWYPGLAVESVRQRFRTNLELTGANLPAYWEDGLYGPAGELRPFLIGEVRIRAHNPCQRCVVPTRDQRTGDHLPGFQKEFMERRRTSLPPWAEASRFNHFYRFAVNTSIEPSEAGKVLRVGDTVRTAIAEAVPS